MLPMDNAKMTWTSFGDLTFKSYLVVDIDGQPTCIAILFEKASTRPNGTVTSRPEVYFIMTRASERR